MSGLKRSWLGCIMLCLFACACDDTFLHLAEARCVGTRCLPVPSEFPDLFADQPEPIEHDGGALTVAWQRPCGCSDELGCLLHGDASWSLGDDGQVTTAFAFGVPDKLLVAPEQTGILLARFDGSGERIWHDEVLRKTHHSFARIPSAALIGDPRSHGLLISSDDEKTARGSPFVQASVFELDANDQLRRLFQTPHLDLPTPALFENDVLIAAEVNNIPEIGRYRRDGTLLWRQTLLQAGEDLPQVLELPEHKLELNSHGSMHLTVSGAQGPMLIEVASNGEVKAALKLPVNGEAGVTKLARDSQDRLVVATGSYFVMRCEAAGCAKKQSRALPFATRSRDEYYETRMLGLAIDAQDRIYVLTQSGVRDQLRLLVDRIDADFAARTTFTLPLAARPDSSFELAATKKGELYALANDIEHGATLSKVLVPD